MHVNRSIDYHNTQKRPFDLLFQTKHKIFDMKSKKTEQTTYTIGTLGPFFFFFSPIKGWGHAYTKKLQNDFVNAVAVKYTLYLARPPTEEGRLEEQ